MRKIILILFALITVFALRAQGDGGSGFNPPNPPDPEAWFKLTVKSAPEEGGTTSPEGKTYHKVGESVHCSASPRLGYKFRAWMIGDEVVSTDQSFYYNLPEENVVLMAWFDKVDFNPSNPGDPFIDGLKHSVSVYVSPSNAGNVSNNNFLMTEGEETVLFAHPNSGYKFLNWKQNGEVISTDRSLSIRMGEKNLEYTAVFEFLPDDPGHPGEDYDDIPLDPPVASVPTDTEVEYGSTVELSVYDDDAIIRYTLDGSDPIVSDTRIRYTEPIVITAETTIKAYAVSEAHALSPVVTYHYTVKSEQTESPVASIASGSEVAQGTKLELTCETAGSKIWYTVDGSDPVSSETRMLYTAPIVINGDMTVKAYAIAEGYYTASGTATFSYTVSRTVTATPSASIASGSEVAQGTKLELTCETAGARIWYTVDSSDPVNSDSCTLYTAPIVIDGDMTVKAYAIADGYYTASGVATFSYTVIRTVTATPSASIASGSEVAQGTKLELTCETPGAKIWYTVDGSDPVSSESRMLYTAPIVIDRDMTIKAYAIAEGYYTASGTATFSYTISRTVTATPSASITSGSEVAQGTKLELTCETSGSKIWYTVDGSDPVNSESRTLYTAPIVIDRDMTVKAYAIADGYYTASGTVTFSYTVSRTVTATPSASIASGSEVAQGTKLELTCETDGAKIWYTVDGSDPVSSESRILYTSPIVINGDMTVKAYAIADGYYTASGVATFSYTVSRIVTATPSASIASGSEVAQGTKLELTCETAGAKIWYTVDGSDPVNSETRMLYTAPIVIDRDMTVKAYAIADGYYTASGVATFSYTVSRIVTATPSASIASGSEVAQGTKLELTCETSGSKIWYTVDGSDPVSSESRTLYTDPIVIDRDMTVKAYATKEGYFTDSEVVTYSYTIKDDTGIDEINGNSLKVSALPSNDGITVTGEFEEAVVAIYDMNGKPAMPITRIFGETTLSLSACSPGVYIIRAESRGKVMTLKIVKD